VEKRDEAEEASGSLSGELRNSRASLRAGVLCGIPASKQVTAGGRLGRASCQLRHDGRLDEDKGLKILAREVTNIAVPKAPISQADWLWDCLTPHSALTESCVFAGAVIFSRKTATATVSSHVVRTVSTYVPTALKGHGFQPCRHGAGNAWPLGPEGQLPQRLKPDFSGRLDGTPEGVPPQKTRRETAVLTCGMAAVSVPRPHHVCTAG
jgi:hypothetical protein